MKYLIRQKVFSFGDNFVIKDGNGQECYTIRGKVFTFGDKLQLEDMRGNQLYYIEQQLLKLLPEYHIYARDQQAAVVKKQLSLFSPRFIIDSIYGNYDIQGNIFGYDFQVRKNGIVVAEVNKKWFSYGDCYGVDIAEGEDHAFLLSIVIVLDQILHDENKR